MRSLLTNVRNFFSLEARPSILTPPFCSEKGHSRRRNFLNSKDNRDGLFIKEVELFKAVVRWVSLESECQGFHRNSGGNLKRKILGETIVKSIHFPLMSQKDFKYRTSYNISFIKGFYVTCSSNILTSDEIIDLVKRFNGVPWQNPLPFLQTPRKGTIRDSQTTRTLGTYIPPAVNWFSHTRGKPPESTRY